MALSRPWYVNMNYTMADTTSSAFVITQCWLWSLKAMFKQEIVGTYGNNGAPPGGAAWTCIQSSDGVTTSSSDLWTGTFDPSKLLRANNGSPHSWIVLRSPSTITALGVPFYCLLSLSASNDQHYTLRCAKTVFSGGTNSNDPTSADEFGFNVGGPILNDQVLASRKISFVTDANGNCFAFMGRTGTGYAHTFLSPFMGFLNPVTGDLFPGCPMIDDRGSSRGALDYQGSIISSGGYSGSDGMPQRSPGGGAVSSTGAGNGIIAPLSGGWFTNTNNNEVNGKHDALAANVLFHNTSGGGLTSIRGSIPDWWMANNAMPVGNVEPATGNTEHMLLGNIYVPNDGVVPSL